MQIWKRRLAIRTVILGASLIMASCSHGILSLNQDSTEKKEAKAVEGTTKVHVQEVYGKLPLYFIQNDGQVDRKVKFYEKGNGHATFFTKEGIYLLLTSSVIASGAKQSHNPGKSTPTIPAPLAGKGQGGGTFHHPQATLVKLILLGANKSPKIVAEGLQEGKVNYFIGNDPNQWKTNVPSYQAVVYKEIYPGIDMKFYGNNWQLEYDIVVTPGTDPSKVKLAYINISACKGDLS